MIYRTHVSMGFATAFSVALLPKSINPFFFIPDIFTLSLIFVIVFVSSLAPDFDEPNSYLSKRFPWVIISVILSSFTKHRGITHYATASLFYSFIVFAIASVFLHLEVFKYAYLLPFLILPYLAHSLGDGCTKGGVPRFYYPFSKKTFWLLPKPLRFYTGSFIETIYFLIFTSILAFELFYLLVIQKPPVLNLLYTIL